VANVIKYGNELCNSQIFDHPPRDGARHLRVEGPFPEERRGAREQGRGIGTEIAETLFPFVDPLDKK
jgi:hypothetical protein